MAPARMVQFMKQHAASCSICQEDPVVLNEIEKITELILPDSKIPKAVRLKQEMDDALEEAEEEVAEEADTEVEEEGEEDVFAEDEIEEPLTPDSTK